MTERITYYSRDVDSGYTVVAQDLRSYFENRAGTEGLRREVMGQHLKRNLTVEITT